MVFPSTFEIALLLTAMAILCLGLWVATYKMHAAQWRFELYYFDFAFGTIAASTLLAVTFGSMGLELTFWDNVTLTASKRMLLWAIFAGAIFNLGNMLVVASASVSGITTAFVISGSAALLVDAGVSLATGRPGSISLFVTGALAALGALALSAMATRAQAKALEPAPATPAPAATAPAPTTSAASALRQRRLSPQPKADQDAEGTPTKGILLAIAGGLILGAVPSLIDLTRHPEIGVGPYALVFLMTVGIIMSTLVYNLYFMNLPVKGAPVPFFRYLQGSLGQHVTGILGGMLWLAGLACLHIASAAPRQSLPAPLILNGAGAFAAALTGIMGIVLWREYKGASGAILGLLGLMLILFIAGGALLAIAPAY